MLFSHIRRFLLRLLLIHLTFMSYEPSATQCKQMVLLAGLLNLRVRGGHLLVMNFLLFLTGVNVGELQVMRSLLRVS